VGVDGGEGAIGGDGGDIFLSEAFGDGLGGFELTVAGLPVLGFEVFWADDFVGSGGFFGAGHLDVSDHEEAVGAWKDHESGGIADREADLVVEGEVGHGTARKNGGVVLVLIGHEER